MTAGEGQIPKAIEMRDYIGPGPREYLFQKAGGCPFYTSDAADDLTRFGAVAPLD